MIAEQTSDMDTLCINTIRFLSVDAVQKANSGHPGTPMGAAPMAHVLWSRIMHYDSQDPDWPNRDRFILSAGHASMLQYSILHLTGYDLSLDDLKQFRQLGSKTPGHPEVDITPGIEITTGPLGQGFANGVGFAIAQKFLASRYNKPGFDLFNYRIFAICSDGDLMEGISSEAGSLAGHLQLGNLIYLYDDNHISIEGDTNLAFSEDIVKRFEGFGWHVQVLEDGNDLKALQIAIDAAIQEKNRPSIIKIRTHIAYGSPNKVDTAGAHGSPLGEEEIRLAKQNLGWDPDKQFYVPEQVYTYYNQAASQSRKHHQTWKELFDQYRKQFPELADEYLNLRQFHYPQGWQESIPVFDPAKESSMATRSASGKVINALSSIFPTLMGGAADLSPSTDTFIKGSDSFQAGSYHGRNLHFGVREHSMGAIINGIAHTGGIIPFGATFLIFSEYMRPPIRMASIMRFRPIFIFTHDSIGLGEDGTTHQPVEQLISLRSIPGIIVLRPADANETAQAWRVAIEHTQDPVLLILSRQKLPVLDQNKYAPAKNLEKGAYVLSDAEGTPELILIATGSEVSLALEAQQKLTSEGIRVRVVSMPSWELFDKQEATYRNSVLLPEVRKRIAIEAGSPLGWHKYVTDEGGIIGINRFGESAPASDLMKVFGFTVDNICEKARKLLDGEDITPQVKEIASHT
ncbi:transketolase [Xanthocytophaga agilis]|uniref:Transketolase n=1 Tax=Xanthocytophaga agilis TaxID=3048010 RepID=A0AAE3UF72_9BACT|nr:transketolase [Xanthocytophaga agilis]MDJ1502111.1 transketolase [Xanthocytophaga agilis]